ncbi:MAG: DUF177 domain-containing protein [Pseudobdellovibrionaceae bacterium]|jgi:uncharacterized protein
MKINLQEIPQEGRSYICNSKTAEFNATLADLIGTQQYQLEFFIKPLNTKDFELLGRIVTSASEQCSLCALDFILPIEASFKEFLVPKLEQPRGTKYSRVNHLSDAAEGPSSVEHDGFIFNMSEYIHETVALAIPFNPRPAEDLKGDCGVCGKTLRNYTFKYDEAMPQDQQQSPFEVLKNMKLN